MKSCMKKVGVAGGGVSGSAVLVAGVGHYYVVKDAFFLCRSPGFDAALALSAHHTLLRLLLPVLCFCWGALCVNSTRPVRACNEDYITKIWPAVLHVDILSFFLTTKTSTIKNRVNGEEERTRRLALSSSSSC